MVKENIKVLLVDDEQLIRSGLKILLSSFEDITIVGEGSDGLQALEICKSEAVNVVLMDIRMPNMNGIEATLKIKELNPDIQILILTTFQDSEYISQAMQLGASGYLLKDSSYEEIYEAIKIANNKNVVLDGKVSKSLLEFSNKSHPFDFQADNYDLTDKEVSIIRLIASGLSNQEIAEDLFLSVGTIKNNISQILSKLELRDRTQLAIFAFERGMMG